jgi:hypothetical protein
MSYRLSDAPGAGGSNIAGHEPVAAPGYDELPHHRRRPLPPIGRGARFRDVPAPPHHHQVLFGIVMGFACLMLIAAMLHIRPQPEATPQLTTEHSGNSVATSTAPAAPGASVQIALPPAGSGAPGAASSAAPGGAPGSAAKVEIERNVPPQIARTQPVPSPNAPPGTPASDAEQKYIAENFASAVMSGNYNKLKTLLDHGADPNAEINPGETALARAAWHGDTTYAATLLAHGALPDLADQEGSTPLIWAASNGNLETIQVLLKYKADPNHRDNQGRTALMRAVLNGHIRVAGYLIEAGADVSIEDKDDHGLAYYARESRHPEMVDFIAKRLAAAGVKP